MTAVRRVLSLAVFCVAFGLCGCSLGHKSISVGDYVVCDVKGLSGRADAVVSIDAEGVMEALAGADATDEQKAKYEGFVGSLAAEADRTEKVGNGDVISVTVAYDHELAEELKIDVRDFVTTVTVEGLAEGTRIDVFKDLEVVVSGVAPYAFVTVTNKSEDPYIKNLEYSVKGKTTGLVNGDEIEVVANVDADRAAEFLYYTDVTTMVYKVENIDSYIYEPELVDKSVLEEIAVECARVIRDDTLDTTTRMLYTISGDNNYLYQDNNERVEYVGLHDVIMLAGGGDGSSEYENVIYLVFEAKVANYNYSETGWFVFMYTNAIMTGDGMLIGHNNPELRYVCGKDLDAVRTQAAQGVDGEYTVFSLEDIALRDDWAE